MDLKPDFEANNPSDAPHTMDRRSLLLRAGGVAAISGVLMGARDASAQDDAKKGWVANASLIEAATDCIMESEACQAHCISSFREGSLMLAECAGLVVETNAVCTALVTLACADSAHLKDLARVSIATCTDCEKECRLHASHHEQCKACADSCLACIEECKKLLA